MNIPTQLKHKPVVVAEDYEKIDGRYGEDSDAKGLSLGLAQWNDRGRVDISAKVWRYSGAKWSRQSEELPLHRVLDLAILLCKTKEFLTETYRFADAGSPLAKVPLQGGKLTIKVASDNPEIQGDLKLFRERLGEDDELLGERFRRLAQCLKELGY